MKVGGKKLQEQGTSPLTLMQRTLNRQAFILIYKKIHLKNRFPKFCFNMSTLGEEKVKNGMSARSEKRKGPIDQIQLRPAAGRVYLRPPTKTDTHKTLQMYFQLRKLKIVGKT